MSEMVERVARAIEAKSNFAISQHHAKALARAVIEAMREPTGEQRAAVRAIPTGNWEIARDYWRTMIDAALKE